VGGIRGGEHPGPLGPPTLRQTKVHIVGREQAQAPMVMLGVVPGKKTWPCARASWIEPNRSGKSGRYLKVLNWASEYGLSLETCGREWVLVTPRSASRKATVRISVHAERPDRSNVNSQIGAS
jgi:hypothetical protein